MRERFGMSARELWTETPMWEIDLLLDEAEKQARERKRQEENG